MEERHYAGPERRQFVRTTKPVQAMVQVPSANALMPWNNVSVHDIGAGGMYFLHSRDFSPDTLLNFKISLSPETKMIRCVGKVLRIKRIQDPPSWSMAVCFVDIDPADISLINNFATSY